ncbi:hypothetical protein FPQ18DRAFT_252238 [Pyronema domesticum]|nr:hypothetical protein FPQ18DRAFT_252238 [Pyronema domesticum]
MFSKSGSVSGKQKDPVRKNQNDDLPPPYSATPDDQQSRCFPDKKEKNQYEDRNPGEASGSSNNQYHHPTNLTPARSLGAADGYKQIKEKDAFAALAAYDIVLLLDDSDSMEWKHLEMVVHQIAERIIPYDDDGIDIYFLKYKTADGNDKFNINKADQVWKLFETVQPTGKGGTPTDDKICAITKAYLDTYKQYLLGNISIIKPMNISCITDGQPNDYINLTDIIKLTARKLKALEDEHRANIGNRELRQLGIQFVQVGSDDEATKFLQKLDTEFEKTPGNPYDIVDVFDYEQWLKNSSSGSTLSGEALAKLLMGGIDPKWDTADEF